MLSDGFTDDVDLTVRTEDEWARIYHLRLGSDLLNVNGMDEFEWAWRLQRVVYQPMPDERGSLDAAERKEAGAMKIARELLVTADPYEKRMLRHADGRYLETKYVLTYKSTH